MLLSVYSVSYIFTGSASAWALNSSDFQLSKIYGNGAFFSFGISVNDKNSSETIAVVSRERQTDRERDRHRDRHRDRQRDAYVLIILCVQLYFKCTVLFLFVCYLSLLTNSSPVITIWYNIT